MSSFDPDNFTELDRVVKQRRNTYWSQLRTAFSDYMVKVPDGNFNSFKYYMEGQYGIRVSMVGTNINSTYQIIDDSKHTIFLLKYGNR